MKLSKLLKRIQHVLIVNPLSPAFALSQDQIKQMNNDDPALQNMALGPRVADCESLTALHAIVAGTMTIVVPWNCELVDAIVLCTATHASGTIQISSPLGAVSDAIVCATVGLIVRMGVAAVTPANNKWTPGQLLTLTVANSAVGKVTLLFKRYQTPAQSNADGS